MTSTAIETANGALDAPGGAPAHPASWSAVLALSVCAFALVASEFLPVSLLTPMASDLQVTEGMAGQGIAISGAFAVVTSLFISALSGGLNRKTLLLGLTAAMGLSGAIVALAGNYVVYMAGRALIGVVIGGFWSMSAATAIRLVPPTQVPRALAILNGGNALATVVAAPLGAYLGAVIGWRGAFLCLVPVALMALAWQWLTLPSMPAAPRAAGANSVFKVFTLFKRRHVAIGMAASSLFFMGQFALFTYVRPFLETVTRIQVPALSLVLLAIGVAGLAGTVLIGRVLQRGFYQTLIAIPLFMAAIAMGLIAFGHWMPAVVGLLALWGLTATAAPVGWWAWVAKTFPHDAEAGGGLLVAVVQMAIALGSTVGGVLFDHSGYQSTFAASALLLVGAGVLAGMTARTRSRDQRVPATPSCAA
ncbi:MFS transporter [Achromobacter spanius]|uniref:MFS transporter n=1 Tax=Achromobacter spanius TaxID=217203 RepID=A0A2S0IDL4_9BURK|nr:MFS transporter [Achromobacter spanius]AVJ30096.1 MFS transporter [Achromobacter spanius]